MTRRAESARGFTLLEMLAATAMVAVLAGSLYASLRIAFRARDSAMQAMGPARRCAAAIALLKDDVRSAVIPNGVLAGEWLGQMQKDATGNEADTLSFYALSRDDQADEGAGDIRKVEFACDTPDPAGGNLLVRRLTTNLLATRTPDP